VAITFDPKKDAINKKQHGISLARAEEIDFDGATFIIDDREDYGELPMQAIGFLGARLYSLIFVEDGAMCGQLVLGRRPKVNKIVMKKTSKSAPTKENPEWTRASFVKSMSFRELPEGLQQALTSRKRGEQKAPKKVPVSIRLSPDVVEAFRSTGAGWQARVDEILRAHIK
jgi:uncharacterized protein (DUF4415 family)/uncharacterized DUF497 family protein